MPPMPCHFMSPSRCLVVLTLCVPPRYVRVRCVMCGLVELVTFQPQFHGCSVRHGSVIRQVRRLQAFVRSSGGMCSHWCTGNMFGLQSCTHTGFYGGFSHWWSNCAHKVHGSPELLPWFPPAESIAVPIFETVAIHVRLLEKQLMSTSRQYARLRRARNPNLIFRDIKGRRPVMVLTFCSDLCSPLLLKCVPMIVLC